MYIRFVVHSLNNGTFQKNNRKFSLFLFHLWNRWKRKFTVNCEKVLVWKTPFDQPKVNKTLITTENKNRSIWYAFCLQQKKKTNKNKNHLLSISNRNRSVWSWFVDLFGFITARSSICILLFLFASCSMIKKSKKNKVICLLFAFWEHCLDFELKCKFTVFSKTETSSSFLSKQSITFENQME